MPDPISFTSASPRFGLPLLFAAQAQKEFFVNQAHALTDLLLHPAIEGEASVPPPDPAEGEAWLVAIGASGAWADRDGCLASFQAGGWVFAAPRDGLRVLDRSAGQDIRYHGGWLRAETLPAPAGGAIVDGEARDAIAALVAALIAGGILPAA
ncbi:MAG TPA: DUF2793 domain-containing protein [Croceibacterium sp.]|nr:DUF2793 domain-containing protein [Croceibacterium sp.]